MSENSKRPERMTTTLHVEALVTEDTLSMRQVGATADLPDGRKVTVEPCISGNGIQITIYAKGGGHWTSYSLSAQALAQAALASEQLQTPLMRCKMRKPNGERIDGCGWQGRPELLPDGWNPAWEIPCPGCQMGRLVPGAAEEA